jgi:hypothetical protein
VAIHLRAILPAAVAAVEVAALVVTAVVEAPAVGVVAGRRVAVVVAAHSRPCRQSRLAPIILRSLIRRRSQSRSSPM